MSQKNLFFSTAILWANKISKMGYKLKLVIDHFGNVENCHYLRGLSMIAKIIKTEVVLCIHLDVYKEGNQHKNESMCSTSICKQLYF